MNSRTEKKIRVCTNCVMDTTDPNITFDANGVCDFCNDYYSNILPKWNNMLADTDALQRIAAEIKKNGEGKKYDCVIGMSGGVDSSYLCYVAKKIMGLRPLAYVIDTGWNLSVADENIKNVTEHLGIDVHVEKVDWTEMRDLQVAFFKAQVPYQDLPQDHAIFAGLYNYVAKSGIKYILTGANNSTECIRPPMEWVYQNDLRFIKDVNKKFGKTPLKSMPQCGMIKYRVIYPLFYGMKRVAPLNMVPYNYDEVKEFLKKELGWVDYGTKHYENIFTRFYEGYYLPHKFGYDKRKSYFSNLILTGAMKREDALEQLQQPGYSEEEIEADKKYIAEKLELSVDEFQKLIDGENKTYRDYKNSIGMIQFGVRVFRFFGLENKKFR